LPYAYNSITFNYAAPSFEDEKGVLFSYYLEGFDKGWSSWSQDAKKYYTNLSEGDYRFRVKANNVYENESTEAVYAFTILPPWQRTVLAYIGLFLGFIGFVWMAIRVSTKGLQNIIKEKTAEVVMQKEEIEMKNQDITDSINYAQKIQQALLPAEETIKKSLPNSFILFKPKDIVSGDFYWYTEKDNKALIAAADCTGHGVPGAFMSMIGTALLNEIVNDTGVTRPADILQALKEGVIKALKQTGDAGTQKDGMDISLCSFDFDKGVVEYAGAYNSLFLIRDNQLEETKADRMPIGIYSDDHGKKFTNHEIKMEKGDVFYLFSDGYLDQFGGPKGKKFMGKRFKGLLMDIFSKSMNEQKAVMDDTIEDWKDHIEDGSVFEQMDDILVIGIKV
jgi:serine phosphatase RsbU (regulator of sigma subunit)